MPELTPRLKATALAQQDDLVDQWLDFERMNGAADTTLKTYRRCMKVFQDWAVTQDFVGRPVASSDILTFKSFLSESYSPATVNLRLSAVRCFYRWAVATDRLPFNPAESVKGVKRPGSRKHKRDALTSAEVRAILDTCDTTTLAGARNRAMLSLFVYCALREVEVVRADLGNLTTHGERMVLEVWGKGRREADEIVVVPESQEEHLRAWMAQRLKIRPCGPTDALFCSLSRRNHGDRLSTRGVRGIVKAAFTEAGVFSPRKSTHSLRHTAITAAIRSGADVLQVRAMARHGSVDTTLGYIHEVNRVDNPAEDLIEY